MLTTNHPDDERLSALAARDEDAATDTALVAHVDGCGRCATLVTELGALRASLADLPDVAPSRPLRLIPAVDPETPGADRLGALSGWVRRFFAPALTVGAALAMIGLVGTTVPALEGMAGGADAGLEMAVPDSQEPAAQGADAEAAGEAGDGQAAGEPGADPRVLATADAPAEEEPETDEYGPAGSRDRAAEELTTDDGAAASLPAERSPWPMVLFAGLALVTGALLLRWILVPRAG